MRLGALTATYAAIGLVVAIALVRRGASLLDGALVILAWPLYAMTLASSAPPAPAEDEPARLAAAVRAALTSVREAAIGSPFSTLLGAAAEARLLGEVERATARMRAIDHELAAAVLDASRAPIAGPGSRTGAAASLCAESETSLRALRAADAAAMSELADLLGALRARIVLARHAGSSAEGPTALVSEVWARIQGLGEAVALSSPPSPGAGAG